MFTFGIHRFRKRSLASRMVMVLPFLLSPVFLFSMGEERTSEPDKNTALSVAKKFYISMSSQSHEARHKASDADYHFKLVHEEFAASPDLFPRKSTEHATPLFYVFNVNSDDGFVIVSGNENVKPILAYAFRGAFNQDDQCPAFRAWMEHYSVQIQHILDNNVETTQKTTEEWKRYKNNSQEKESTPFRQVAALLPTSWNQNYPYSMSCPADTNRCDGRAPAGCVAVAMAQIIKFWEYPDTCNEMKGYYSVAYEWINGIESSTYDWSVMPDELCDSSLECEIEEVSRLILSLWCIHKNQLWSKSYGRMEPHDTRGIFRNLQI